MTSDKSPNLATTSVIIAAAITGVCAVIAAGVTIIPLFFDEDGISSIEQTQTSIAVQQTQVAIQQTQAALNNTPDTTSPPSGNATSTSPPVIPTITNETSSSSPTRADKLASYSRTYQSNGFCSMWSMLVADGLVEGACPNEPIQIENENVISDGTTVSVTNGLQLRISSDLKVNYPACVIIGTTSDFASYSGGIVKPRTDVENIATNLTLHQNSVFTLYPM